MASIIRDDDQIISFDIVNVYARDMVPFANLFPVRERFHCITRWTTDGMPFEVKRLSNSETEGMIQKLSGSTNGSSSYLYGLPHFGRKEDFVYFSSKVEQRVTFGDSYCRFLAGSECEKTKRFACKNGNAEEEVIVEDGSEEDVQYDNDEEDDDFDHHVNSPLPQTKTPTKEDNQQLYNEYLTSLSSPVSPMGMYGCSYDDADDYGTPVNEEGEEEWDTDDTDSDEEEDSEESESDSDSDEEEDVRPTNFNLKGKFLTKRQDTPVPRTTKTWEESFFS
jgi:hypothetical protein